MPISSEEQKRLIHTGRSAYKMLIPVTGNPHGNQAQRDLWDKGWRLERKKDDIRRPQRDDGRPPAKRPGEQARAGNRVPFKKHEHRQPFPRRPVELPKTVLTEKMVERFNRRHQTKA